MYEAIAGLQIPVALFKTLRSSLTKVTILLPQSHSCSCYVSRTILAPLRFLLQKNTQLRANYFA